MRKQVRYSRDRFRPTCVLPRPVSVRSRLDTLQLAELTVDKGLRTVIRDEETYS